MSDAALERCCPSEAERRAMQREQVESQSDFIKSAVGYLGGSFFFFGRTCYLDYTVWTRL